MPPSRDLAQQLGMSRATVVRAYELLISQKYLRSVKGVGTFVNELAQYNIAPEDPSNDTLTPVEGPIFGSGSFHELNYGAAPSELLPTQAWQTCLKKNLGTFAGSPASPARLKETKELLKAAIAKYLGRARAIRCQPDQVFLFGSVLRPLDLVTNVMVRQGDTVTLENPGYPYARHAFREAGAELVFIPTDSEGAVVDKIPQCKLVYITPSHQDPTGVVLSKSRREWLLSHCRKSGITIIEDDYDYEFRYTGANMPALRSIEESAIYISSFWKTLFPIVTLGILVVPKNLVTKFREAEAALENNIPMLDQITLTDLVEQGHLEKHIHRTKPIYAQRLRALIRSITEHLKDSAILNKESSGTHLLVRFSNKFEEKTIVAAAARVDLPIISTAPYYDQDYPGNEFLIPFGHLEENEIEKGIAALASELNENS